MFNSCFYPGCAVGFFGLGKSNIALMNCLPLGNCRVVIRSDEKINRSDIPSHLSDVKIIEGNDARENISEDILIFSPSVRRECSEFQKAKNKGVKFTSDAELFFENLQGRAIGITGSDGKSTTSALTHLILEKSGYRCSLVGNIGEPMVASLRDKSDYYICELSSFMLQYLSPPLNRACITNITPNHLNWHSSFDEYRDAKMAILKNAEKSVFSDDFKQAYAIFSTEKSYKELLKTHDAKIFITSEDGFICKNGERLVEICKIRRNEPYNLKNLMCAIGLTHGLCDNRVISAVAADFPGLEHRCELFLSRGGIDFYDSSIDTSPMRTAQTLDALGKEVVIILGGSDKGLDYDVLVPAVKRYVRHAIITGDNANKIYSAIKDFTKAEIQDDFDVAVMLGMEYAKAVGTLLLSPASASYDKFKDYRMRGCFFKEIVLKCK